MGRKGVVRGVNMNTNGESMMVFEIKDKFKCMAGK
jgi:hypothetical protein